MTSQWQIKELKGSGAKVGDGQMARTVRKNASTARTKEVSLSQVKDDLSRYLKEAAGREIIITRHGKPAGVLIGFESEDDWFEYRLENDPRFLQRRRSRKSSRRPRGTSQGCRHLRVQRGATDHSADLNVPPHE